MKKLMYILIALFLMVACRKPYDPPVVKTDHRYLVVEGLINTGIDSTIIEPSCTVNIKSVSTTRPELGAVVTVESDQNGSYSLTDALNGNYISAGLNADAKQKYRLRIHTTDGNTYRTNFCEVKITQPIDSLEAIIKDNGIETAGTYSEKRIFLQNHDLPAWLPIIFYDTYQYYGCGYFVETVTTPTQIAFWNQGTPPFYTPTIKPFLFSPTICVDCSLRGTKTPPPFWPN